MWEEDAIGLQYKCMCTKIRFLFASINVFLLIRLNYIYITNGNISFCLMTA